MSAKAAGAGGKLHDLEQQLAQKKAMLSQTEKQLKLATLEKELVEKKRLLERLVANKHEQEEQQKQRQEDDAQQQMVAQLVAAARSAAAASPKAPAAPIKAAPATAEAKPKAQTVADAPAKASKTTPKEQAIAAILENMKVQAKNVSDSIAAMDANEKKRQAELQHNFQAPTTGKKDAIAKGQAMLKLLAKKEHRNYEKARALRESELRDLNDGMRSVEKGDVQALTKLMGKMQQESKTLQAKSKNFLY